MPTELRFFIEGEVQLSAYLGTAANNVKDFGPALQKSKHELLKSFDLNFSGRGNLFGGWAPRQKNYPWPLLERTGAMRSAFQGVVTASSLTLSNSAPYFGYHQSRESRSRLPRRIMMKIDAARRNFIVKTFQEHIHNVVRGRK